MYDASDIKSKAEGIWNELQKYSQLALEISRD